MIGRCGGNYSYAQHHKQLMRSKRLVGPPAHKASYEACESCEYVCVCREGCSLDKPIVWI